MSKLLKSIIINSIIILVFCLGLFIFIKHLPKSSNTNKYAIIDKYATRVLYLYEENIAKFWDWEVPDDAIIYEQKEEVKSHDATGKPIYATKYYYGVKRWFFKRSITQKINHDETWEEYITAENELIKVNRETYTIVIKNSQGQIKTRNISKDDWDILQVGNTIKITKDNIEY